MCEPADLWQTCIDAAFRDPAKCAEISLSQIGDLTEDWNPVRLLPTLGVGPSPQQIVVDVGNRKDRRVAGIHVSDALDRDAEIEKDPPIVIFRTKLWIQKIAARRVTGCVWRSSIWGK